MAKRIEFTNAQRLAAKLHNRLWLSQHTVDGVLIEERFQHLREQAEIFYCENCLFCHADERFFDVDHLVPDAHFKQAGNHHDAGATVNMILLCKSLKKGDYGCNQTKSSGLYVPKGRGLAYTRRREDMNCYPLDSRPFCWC